MPTIQEYKHGASLQGVYAITVTTFDTYYVEVSYYVSSFHFLSFN